MQSFINIKSRRTKVKISKKLWESNLFSHLDKSFLKVGVGSYLKMQYEYAISDTAIAEKKVVPFCCLQRCIYCGRGFAFRTQQKKVFLVALVMIILRSLEQSERDGLTATVIYIFEAFFCRIIALLYADNQVLRN